MELLAQHLAQGLTFTLAQWYYPILPRQGRKFWGFFKAALATTLQHIKNNLFSCPAGSDSAILWTVACRPPLSMEFSRQEYWVATSFSNDSVDTLGIVLNFAYTMLTSLFH